MSEAIEPEVIEGLKDLGSATIFNAIVELTGGSVGRTGLKDYTGPEIRCLLPDLGATVGFAFTCELTTSDPNNESVPWDDYFEALDRTQGPVVAVLKDVSRRVGRGVSFGNEMAATHRMLGVTGVVVDGTVRDLAGIREEGLPIWARGLVAGHGATNLVRVNPPVTVADLHIGSGDLLVMDLMGVVKVPAGISPVEVLSRGREVNAREAEYRALVGRRGTTLQEARDWRRRRGVL